jgi:hypothetical protein
MKQHKAKIPEPFVGSHCLRLEYGINRRAGIKARFGRDLTAYDLFHYDTYRRLLNLYLEAYKAIPKTGRSVFVDKSRPVKPSKLEKALAQAYREKYPEEYAAFLQGLKEAGAIDEETMKRIRRTDREAGRDYNVLATSPLIAELDCMIELAIWQTAP